MKTTFFTLALLLFASSQAQAEEDSKHHFGLQGGWYSIEMDYESPVGVFASFGSPLILMLKSGPAVLPLHIRGGYGFQAADNLHIRLGLRLITITSFDGPLFSASSTDKDEAVFWWMLMPELEFRYSISRTVCIGFAIPITALGYRYKSTETDGIFLPYAPLLTQVYLAYQWEL